MSKYASEPYYAREESLPPPPVYEDRPRLRPEFDPWYLASPAGGFKILQLVGTLGAMVCMFLINAAMIGTYFAALVNLCAFAYAFILLILHLGGLYYYVTIIDLPLWDLLLTAFGAVCMAASTAVMAYSSIKWPMYRIAWGATAGFAFVATVAFTCDAIRLYMARRKQAARSSDTPASPYSAPVAQNGGGAFDYPQPAGGGNYHGASVGIAV